MASKRVDSFSAFLETVDDNVRAARMKGSGDQATTGVSPAGIRLLARLQTTEDGAAPVDQVRADLGFGVLELGTAVAELADRGLARVIRTDGTELVVLTSPPSGA